MYSRSLLTVSLPLAILAALALAAPAAAEERSPFEANIRATLNKALAFPAAAQAAQTTATTQPNEHQFGAGVRLSENNFGIGGSIRYFFYPDQPVGVQAEISRYGVDFGNRDFDSVQFSPSVIYRFQTFEFEAPLSLTPYGGIGLSFIHSDFGEDEQFFEDIVQADDTDVGLLLYGGVELFFERVPNLGVSGELTFNSNDEIVGGGFGAELGGVSFTAAAHWYFW